MSNAIEELKKEVWGLFRDTQPVFLATLDGSKPRVRPVTLIHFDMKLWVSTGANNAKIKQIKTNGNVEFCLLLEKGENKGYVRGTGVADIVEDMETKKLLSENIPFFTEYWKDFTDPEFALLQVHVQDIEYLRPGVFDVQRFPVR
ncbi:hypothetical protein AMJ83_08840 [candidate division WOR_3 bacterium SM23_42]|uniref:Pyridoxamine 5'-phosphate oxidase N-terminal domain-containing protein n=1 Tax=candidate division WOR_3 bacterium SM23_42 TaxID=1703779 RepID=A0A0S8FQG9_UNCW3|nr:MAG: hypothetical protein AMJ83_08840 [candidate division WOR_3 bacterium SM23_42]